MAGKTQFEQYIADEIEKNRGRLVPVKASLAERMFVRKAHWKKLHPNPDDEFCFPSIGPNYEILSNYEEMIVHGRCLNKAVCPEPITVEKVLPDGYLILNGHHRWGARARPARKKTSACRSCCTISMKKPCTSTGAWSCAPGRM